MKKVVIAIDSFKGSLTSAEANNAAAQGVRNIFPDCEILCIPIADGGEGTSEILTKILKGHTVPLRAHNPLMQQMETHYTVLPDHRTAIIEMANINGLTLIPIEKRNPLLTTSYGTGELIYHALEKGYRNFIIGIGGSATNDAGIGMLQALGFRFLDKIGNTLGTGGAIMSEVTSIDFQHIHPALQEASFTVACDVDNPFYGPQGATYVFGRQKGASETMLRQLEAGMQNFARIIRQTTGKDISSLPGAGAAGGLGGSLAAFLQAVLKPGTELILEMLDFKSHIHQADVILTGEGKADRQTIRGKVPFGILSEAKKQNIPVLLIAGSVEDVETLNSAGFTGVYSITPSPVCLDKAMQPIYAKKNIRLLVSQIFRTIQTLDC